MVGDRWMMRKPQSEVVTEIHQTATGTGRQESGSGRKALAFFGSQARQEHRKDGDRQGRQQVINQRICWRLLHICLDVEIYNPSSGFWVCPGVSS